MSAFRSTSVLRAAAVLLLLFGVALLVVGLPGATSAAGAPIFDAIPVPYPGSFPSLGGEAYSMDELGDHIMFAASGKTLDNVVVSMTDWACENDFTWDGSTWVPDRDGYAGEACVTTPGTGFTHDITLNLYEVDNTGPDPALGPLIATKTGSFFMPYRPSYDSTYCYTGSGKTGALSPADDVPFGGTWYSAADDRCYHGYAFNITFDFSGDNLVLPDEVIYGVAYNTANHGAAPLGVAGPYSSLNVSLATVPPTVGTDVEPDALFWDTSYGPFYTDGGAGGVDIFRRDTGWSPYVVAVQFNPVSVTNYYFSAEKAGVTSDSVAFGPEDILAYDTATSSWSLFFDGSAFGLTPKHNVTVIDVIAPDDIFMSLGTSKIDVPGVPGKVTGNDILYFDGAGFTMYFDGSDVGLTGEKEKIDALAVLDGSVSPIPGSCLQYLLISLNIQGRVPGIVGVVRGEDILGFCATNLGDNTAGFWHVFLDGSNEGLPPNAIKGLASNADATALYFVTNKAINVPPAVGGHSTVFKYDVVGDAFSGPLFNAQTAGLPKKVDAMDLGGDLP